MIELICLVSCTGSTASYVSIIPLNLGHESSVHFVTTVESV